MGNCCCHTESEFPEYSSHENSRRERRSITTNVVNCPPQRGYQSPQGTATPQNDLNRVKAKGFTSTAPRKCIQTSKYGSINTGNLNVSNNIVDCPSRLDGHTSRTSKVQQANSGLHQGKNNDVLSTKSKKSAENLKHEKIKHESSTATTDTVKCLTKLERHKPQVYKTQQDHSNLNQINSDFRSVIPKNYAEILKHGDIKNESFSTTTNIVNCPSRLEGHRSPTLTTQKTYADLIQVKNNGFSNTISEKYAASTKYGAIKNENFNATTSTVKRPTISGSLKPQGYKTQPNNSNLNQIKSNDFKSAIPKKCEENSKYEGIKNESLNTADNMVKHPSRSELHWSQAYKTQQDNSNLNQLKNTDCWSRTIKNGAESSKYGSTKTENFNVTFNTFILPFRPEGHMPLIFESQQANFDINQINNDSFDFVPSKTCTGRSRNVNIKDGNFNTTVNTIIRPLSLVGYLPQFVKAQRNILNPTGNNDFTSIAANQHIEDSKYGSIKDESLNVATNTVVHPQNFLGYLPQIHEAREANLNEIKSNNFQSKKEKYSTGSVLHKSKFPCDFRLLQIIPSVTEILHDKKPFLLPAVIDNPYENVDEYLNTQFRLMKEDTFRSFRLCITDYLSHKRLENGKLYTNAYLLKIEYTISEKLWYFIVPVREDINWKTTKCLASGSFICLSHDGFKTFYFASIHSRKDDGNDGNICCLVFSFENMIEPKVFSFLFDIIETRAFYESYYHAAKVLKTLDSNNFPFRNSFIDFCGCSRRPFKMDSMQMIKMRNFQHTIGEKIQGEAFELALTKKIALIQGPPGTGKSYLGSQIVRFLVEVAPINKPLIVMCFTNHALDQFLEKTLNFTKKVIRIGGGSKNDKLDAHNLRNISECLRLKSKNLRSTDGEVDLHPSCEVVMDLFNGIMPISDNSVGHLYGGIKQRIDTLNHHLHDYLMRNYPFNSSYTNATLGDSYDLNDVFLSSVLSEHIYNAFRRYAKHIKLHDWLMTTKSKSQVYHTIPNFVNELTKELLHWIQVQHLKLEDTTAQSTEDEKSNDTALADLLIKLSIQNLKRSTDDLEMLEQLENFVYGHMYSSEAVFPLFVRAAVSYNKEHNISITVTCDNLWELSLTERWQFISVVMEAAFQEKIKHLGNGNAHFRNAINVFDAESHDADLKNLKLLFVDKDVNILKQADIIGITTTGASKYRDILTKLQPTTFIVDEAAEVLESHIIAALSSNIKHLVLIGDHFQLRPLPTEHDLAVNYNLEISLFERLFNNGVPSKCLEVQHRMRSSISSLLVPEFYSILEDHPSVLKYENVVGVSSNVFFLQHSQGENSVDELKSHSNSYECAFIVNFCEYLISQGHNPQSITILTTYAGQLHLIKKQIFNKNCLSGILATTVDGYQGEENDIILMSFVRSNPQNQVGFIKTKNRICVALSRARKGLYCIGNFEMFARKSEVWNALLNKLTKMHSFGEHLKIYCCKHPQRAYRVKTPRDLRQHMETGCQETCDAEMTCSHTCRLSCHNTDAQHICFQRSCSGINHPSNVKKRRRRKNGKDKNRQNMQHITFYYDSP